MAPLLVRPKPLRPTAPPSPRAPSSLHSGGRHVAASCPPAYEASSSSSHSSGNSNNAISRRRSTSTSSKHPRRTSSPSSVASASAPPSPSSLVLSSPTGGAGEGLHDYSALEELLSILSAPEGMRASPPPILLPPSRTASRNGNGLSRNGSSSNYGSAHRRRSSSIALMRAGSPEMPGLLYSPPSRALTRNPFHRHAATAAAFLPSHIPGASPISPIAYPSCGAATMPVIPSSGGALKMIMGEGVMDDETSGVSELAPPFEHEAIGGVDVQTSKVYEEAKELGEAAPLKEGERT